MTAPSRKYSQQSFMMFILIGFLLTINLISCGPSVALRNHVKKACLLDQALETIALNRNDLAIRSDLSLNPFAVSLFNRWMEAPLKAPIEAQLIARKLFSIADRADLWLKELATLGDIHSHETLSLEKYTDYELPSGLPNELKLAIQLILDAIYTANMKLNIAREEIPPEKMGLIKKYLYPDFLREREAEGQGEEFLRIRELKQAIVAGGSVDRKAIFEAGLTLLRALTDARELLTKSDKWHQEIRSFSISTSLGLVEIGGTGSDIHKAEAALIIDLGGNDLYMGRVASGAHGKCAIVLDLSGDDLYLGEDLTQGSGFWGVGLLMDISGNDLYRAGNGSQGAGLFGIGLLIDEGGHDGYMGEKFVQAASSWGWAGLIDLAGEDTYQCQSSGQAYSEVLGIACLCDLNGNDKYLSGSRSPDPREPDMNQSFSQGFAMGMRNSAAGGFALLADKSGNDIYQCQYFGQGASYWMGIGILYDESGKDTYMARRYAQGAGIHYSLGLFLDVEGNDQISSWGVSQGCGHDYGIGILINHAGDDTYVSNWLSMGASEANGVGIFVDNLGNDGYETNTGMAVSRLVEARRAGGVGLFLDAGGEDRYSNNGANNSAWGPNRWAIGIDREEKGSSGLSLLPLEASAEMSDEAERARIEEKVRLSKVLVKSESMPYPDSIEGLLSVATHWGLEREIPKEAEEKLLNLTPEKSVPVMVDLIDTPDIMSLIFMERFFAVHASHAIPALTRKAESSDQLIKSRALFYLGQLKDSRSLKYCIEALGEPSWGVKSSAIRAIGEILNKTRLDLLIPMKEAFSEALKKDTPDPLEDYLKDNKHRTMTLSVVVRAIPLNYNTYQKYAELRSGIGAENAFKDYVGFVYDHRVEIMPLLERWIKDIHESEGIAERLMDYLNDPDPAVKRAAAYSLGQMNYGPAIPQLIALLKDPRLWVRDATVLALSLFEDDAVSPIDSAMEHEGSPFKILSLDLLARIKSDRSKALVVKYLNDSDDNVRRAARQALSDLRLTNDH
ncbi:MAG: HEAT repeat domain-containing protein [Pseudomonadota bacterium]